MGSLQFVHEQNEKNNVSSEKQYWIFAIFIECKYTIHENILNKNGSSLTYVFKNISAGSVFLKNCK